MSDPPPPPYPGASAPGDPSYPGYNPNYAPPPMDKSGMPPPGQPYEPPPPGYGPPPGGQPGYPPGYGPPPPAAGQPGYPPAGQPGYGQQGYSHTTTVVVPQPVVTTTVVQHFRETPVQTACPHCHAQIVTGTHYETGTFSWLICAVLCMVGCDCGCCLIPFCVDGCRDVVHSCPNCNQQVSRWSRL